MGFINWHKKILETYKQKLSISDYQVMWIAFFKGLIIGGLVLYFYLR